MASSGSFSGSIVSGHYQLRVDWSQAQNVSANTSTITAKIYLVNDWSLNIYGRTSSITINGTSQSYTSDSISTTGTHLLGTVTQSVAHDSDGSKSIAMSCVFNIQATISGTYYGSISCSANVTLDTIPRASSVSMPTTTMGSEVTISINPAVDQFTHTLTYSFGSASGTIATKTSLLAVKWTPALTLANQIPNATSGTGTLTCQTYSGSTLIGTKSITITLKVPTSVVPTIGSFTATRVDNDVPSSWGIYVQNKSAVTLTISNAAGARGSTIKSYSITGGTYSGSSSTLTTGVLVSSGSYTFTAKVTDSRGRTATKTVSISVVAYSPPSFTGYSSYRSNSSGTASDTGTYIRGLVNYTYASCSSKNSVTRATYYKRSSATSWTNASKSFTSGTAFTFGGGNISTEYTYDVKYTLTDAFSTISVTDTVSTAAVLMDFLSGGRGIAIGKVAETENCLEVSQDWTTKLNGPVYLGTATLGAQNKPIYLSNGLPTASSVDIGSSTKPIYMHQGALTASTSTVGGAGTPVYLKAGALTACTPSSIVTSVVGDYVTSVGTSGIWTYRKWNSGAAECWGVYTASGVNIAKNNYSGFRYSDGISVNLPFTFAAAPAGVYSGGCTSYLTFVTPIGQPTTTQVKFWVACLDSSATSCSIVVNIHVMGKWK